MIVREARTDGEVDTALRLRHEVFCEEQGVALGAEQDGRDASAVHLLVLDGAELIGTCRSRGRSAWGAWWCAPTAAAPAHERAGYEVEGAVLMEEGIEHVTMEKRLA